MNYKLEKLISIAIVVGSLIAIVITYRMTMFDTDGNFFGGKDITAQMPDIVGFSYSEVQAAYDGWFELEAASEDYSETFAEGAILSQSIPAWEDYTVGKTTVKVTVSKGRRPAETAVTEAAEDTADNGEDTEDPQAAEDTDVFSEPAEFEKFCPEFELEVTAVGMEIPAELENKLYSLLRRNGADAGYLYYDPQTGGSLEYNADEKFSAGSIIKAIYARSILDPDMDLSAEYEMTEELLNSPYELVNGEPVGTLFTAEELIRAALVKSDNTAYKMLYNYIGYEKFNRYAAGLGLSQRMDGENCWFRLTARESAVYFKDIYEFIRSSENGGLMLECLSNADYRDMFSAALPEKQVAEKYGYLPQEEFYTLGDCAVIMGDTDYILAAYLRGTEDGTNTEFFRDIAEITDEIHELN